MKKINIKIISIIIIVVLTAAVSIFYACTKEQNNQSVDNTLKKESSFNAKILDGTCLNVDVYRDKDNNVQINTKKISPKSNIDLGLFIPVELNIKPEQQKENDSIIFIVPDDAIYWLVPFDNQTPIKFDPQNSTKETSGSGSIRPYCTCFEGTSLSNSCCVVRHTIPCCYKCFPENKTCGCDICNTIFQANSGNTEYTLNGSCYLVKSNTITINGNTYE